MTPDELKALRKELSCTAKELATALGLEQAEVLDWEKGERFPTKPFIDRMEALRKNPAAIPRKAKGGDPMKVMADPAFWELVRKLAFHKKLRDEAKKLAEKYADPSESEG